MAPMLKLDIVIVGAGLSGLASACALALNGHRVRVIDKTSGLPPHLGAIRVPPNAAKVLAAWGLHDELAQKSSLIDRVPLIDMYNGGEEVGHTEWSPEMFKDSGGDFHMMGYRDLCEIILERAQSVGAKFIWNRTVVSVVPPADSSGDGERSVSASVTLCSGRVLTADLVIGADGAQSIVRKLVDEGAADGLLEAKYTGTTIYTGIMDTADIMADPTMADIVPLRHPFWMGDNCIAMAYPMRNDKAFGFHVDVVREPSDHEEVSWSWDDVPASEVPLDRLEIRLQSFLKHATTLTRAHCYDLPPSEDRVDESERIILIGQAAHPMMPSAMHQSSDCLESACILGVLLSHLRSMEQLPSLLYAYQDLREKRSPRLHELELGLRAYCGMTGDAREARDENMRAIAAAAQARHDRGLRPGEGAEEDTGPLAQQFAEVAELWGYDAHEAAEEWWLRWGLLRERSECVGDDDEVDNVVGGVEVMIGCL